jgi:hypothetical protein
VFYISTAGSIIETNVQCTISSGNCNLQGSYTLSDAVTTGINNASGLAATLRGSTDGYRVFYHDLAGRTKQIRYSAPLNMTWGQEVSVIDTLNEGLIGLATAEGANLTMYGIDQTGDILSADLMNDGSYLKGIPFESVLI